MKTLADLKRDAAGKKLFFELSEWYGETDPAKIPERLHGVRACVRINTVAIFLKNSAGVESELRLCKASLVEYTGDSLIIYQPGERELTPDEKREFEIFAADLEAYEKQNPHGDPYWRIKSFWKNSAFPYLAGFETVHGKRLIYKPGAKDRGDYVIIDDAIKGAAILKYKITEIE